MGIHLEITRVFSISVIFKTRNNNCRKKWKLVKCPGHPTHDEKIFDGIRNLPKDAKIFYFVYAKKE